MASRIKEYLRKVRILFNESLSYRRAKSCLKRNCKSGKGLIIVPCDPYSVIGSRGDEAMITAVMQHYRQQYGAERPIWILSSTMVNNAMFASFNRKYGAELLKIWDGVYPLEALAENIGNLNPDKICILGADCMDGFYSVSLSYELFALYCILATKNYNVTLLGFSYNARPERLLNLLYRRIGKKQIFNLRDENSLVRFKKYTSLGNARLVADTAFALVPERNSDGYRIIQSWKTSMEAAGHKIFLAFNFHPMLQKDMDKERLNNAVKNIAGNLKDILRKYPQVAVALIPHDDRKGISDVSVLSDLYQQIVEARNGNRVIFLDKVYRADELKGMAELFSGVISSRMHFAIAALGSGVPVLVADYQDKFAGLFAHFKLPDEYILSPDEFYGQEFVRQTESFIGSLDVLKSTVEAHLPQVKALSAINFRL